MYRLLVTALVAFCALTVCSADLSTATPFLTGGTNAAWGDFPSVVSIDSPFNLHCVGNVVDQLHVVTSAQCVLNATFHTVNPFWITVVAGDINLAPRSVRREVRNVTAIFVNPNFNPFSLFGDLAVLRLDRPFVFPLNTIQAATRSTRIVPVGTTCRFSGWGSAAANQIAPAQVVVNQRVINQIVLNSDVCNQGNMHRERVLESMICAGNTAASPTAPCNGNLGGGLYCLVGGVNQLTGILSFGLNCGLANNPPVYQQMRFYNAWIQSQFTRTDLPPLGWSPVPQV